VRGEGKKKGEEESAHAWEAGSYPRQAAVVVAAFLIYLNEPSMGKKKREHAGKSETVAAIAAVVLPVLPDSSGRRRKKEYSRA